MSDISHSIPLRHDILMTVKPSPFLMVNRPNVYGLARWRSLGKLQPAVPRPTKAARQHHVIPCHIMIFVINGGDDRTLLWRHTANHPFDRGTCIYIYTVYYIYIYIYISPPQKKTKTTTCLLFLLVFTVFFWHILGDLFSTFL